MSVVWGGRFSADHPGSMDGWTLSQAELGRHLDDADALVLLDPLSFPWEWLRPADAMLPLVVALPDGLDADAIGVVLGEPLLRMFTPADRLVTANQEVAGELVRRWQLDRSWVVAELPESPGAGRHEKAVWDTMRASLTGAMAEFADPELVGDVALRSEDADLAAGLSRALGRPVRHVAPAGHEGSRAAVSALVLPPGTSPTGRRALIADAFEALQPGGLFLLVATVVAGRDEPAPVPSMDDLVEDLQAATGMGLAPLDIRSLRWADEPLRRGVLLAGASLEPVGAA